MPVDDVPREPPSAPRVRAEQAPVLAGVAASTDDPESPVVRAVPGNWGMFFRFGGLSSLTASGNARDIEGMIVTQVGMRYVASEHWVVPMAFGTGVRLPASDRPESGDVLAGVDVSVGFEYHFRQWRRISPFVGVSAGGGITHPDRELGHGGFGLGPTMGVEYYVADRVSLIAQYLLVAQLEIVPGGPTSFLLNTMSGGSATLVVYF